MGRARKRDKLLSATSRGPSSWKASCKSPPTTGAKQAGLTKPCWRGSGCHRDCAMRTSDRRVCGCHIASGEVRAGSEHRRECRRVLSALHLRLSLSARGRGVRPNLARKCAREISPKSTKERLDSSKLYSQPSSQSGDAVLHSVCSSGSSPFGAAASVSLAFFLVRLWSPSSRRQTSTSRWIPFRSPSSRNYMISKQQRSAPKRVQTGGTRVDTRRGNLPAKAANRSRSASCSRQASIVKLAVAADNDSH